MKESLNDKYIYYLCFKSELAEKYGLDLLHVINEVDNNIDRSIGLAINILGNYSCMLENSKKDKLNEE